MSGLYFQLPHLRIGIVFTSEKPSITSVTISPKSATMSKGQSLKLSANVVTVGFANKAVEWSVDSTSQAQNVTIKSDGTLYVPTSANITSITVTAKSIYDNAKTDTATITVS